MIGLFFYVHFEKTLLFCDELEGLLKQEKIEVEQ